MIWITLVLWIAALLDAKAKNERLIDQITVRIDGNRVSVWCTNYFLAAAIMFTVVDIGLYLILFLVYFGGLLASILH